MLYLPSFLSPDCTSSHYCDSRLKESLLNREEGPDKATSAELLTFPHSNSPGSNWLLLIRFPCCNWQLLIRCCRLQLQSAAWWDGNSSGVCRWTRLNLGLELFTTHTVPCSGWYAGFDSIFKQENTTFKPFQHIFSTNLVPVNDAVLGDHNVFLLKNVSHERFLFLPFHRVFFLFCFFAALIRVVLIWKKWLRGICLWKWPFVRGKSWTQRF